MSADLFRCVICRAAARYVAGRGKSQRTIHVCVDHVLAFVEAGGVVQPLGPFGPRPASPVTPDEVDVARFHLDAR